MIFGFSDSARHRLCPSQPSQYDFRRACGLGWTRCSGSSDYGKSPLVNMIEKVNMTENSLTEIMTLKYICADTCGENKSSARAEILAIR